MNRLTFHEDRVVKKFGSRKRFETELNMRDLFAGLFSIPKILDVNYAENIIHFERVSTLPTQEIMRKMRLEEMLGLFEELPRLKGRRVRNDQKIYVLSKVTDPCIADFIDRISLDGEDLIHGDFRPHNVLQTTDGLYLVDFELSDYGDREKDMAYWYIGTIYFNPQRGSEFLEHMRKQPNYNKFLFYCLYYSFAAAENPLSSQDGLNRLSREVCEEIKTILK